MFLPFEMHYPVKHFHLFSGSSSSTIRKSIGNSISKPYHNNEHGYFGLLKNQNKFQTIIRFDKMYVFLAAINYVM